MVAFLKRNTTIMTIIVIIIIFIDLYYTNINPGKEIFTCALHLHQLLSFLPYFTNINALKSLTALKSALIYTVTLDPSLLAKYLKLENFILAN